MTNRIGPTHPVWAPRGRARTLALAVVVTAAISLVAARAEAIPPGEPPFTGTHDWARCMTSDLETGELSIDASCFFDELIARYRGLTAYQDVADVLQVTARSGEQPLRLETRIGCVVTDGKLRVDTPASILRRRMAAGLSFRRNPIMEAAALEYGIWLAPHMALKFAEHPKADFRSGIAAGFTPIEAASVTVNDKPMVHLELRSGDGSESEEDCEASFDLYVNPDSMLIERIQGQQRLPDGATYETTLTITPTHAVIDVGDVEPERPVSEDMFPAGTTAPETSILPGEESVPPPAPASTRPLVGNAPPGG